MSRVTSSDDFEARRRARATWPITIHRLTEDPPEALPDTIGPAERLAIAWRLSVEAWTLSGRTLPDYDRAHAPARFFRRGERPPSDDE